jgi:SNF2 family DNA or RNA helicase
MELVDAFAGFNFVDGDEIDEVAAAELHPRLGVRMKLFPYPYQEKMVRRMESVEGKLVLDTMRGGIVAEDMGLGKTIQTQVLAAIRPGTYPTLVLVPKTLLTNWGDEVPKFWPSDAFKILLFHKDEMKKAEYEGLTDTQLRSYTMVVTTYGVVAEQVKAEKKRRSRHRRRHSGAPDGSEATRGPGLLMHVPWHRVVCDESHMFANPETAIFKAVCKLKGRYRWCLSGTPVGNRCTDAYSQFAFVGFDKIDHRAWTKHSMDDFNLRETSFLRLDYEMAGVKLPPLHHKVHWLEATHMELRIFTAIVTAFAEVMDEFAKKKTSFSNVLAMFTRLRQAAIAPFLMVPVLKESLEQPLETEAFVIKSFFDDDDDDDNEKDEGSPLYRLILDKMEPQDIVWLQDRGGGSGANSSKMRAVLGIIGSTLTVPNKKTLVFSAFTQVLNLVDVAMRQAKAPFTWVQIDGTVKSTVERKKLINTFQTEPDCRVMLINYRCGSVGLNLVQATEVIKVDPWWNPSTHLQAEKRAHRIGQTQPVTVHNIYIVNTVEDRILKIQKHKSALARFMMDGDDGGGGDMDQDDDKDEGLMSLAMIKTIVDSLKKKKKEKKK